MNPDPGWIKKQENESNKYNLFVIYLIGKEQNICDYSNKIAKLLKFLINSASSSKNTWTKFGVGSW